MNEFKLLKGTNISHWLSQSDARGEERKKRFTIEDVRYLADFGFDHLRLPIDEEQMWDNNFQKNNEAWDLLHEGIEWCRNAGLKVVVDLHILRCHHFNGENGENTLFTDPAMQLHFAECWRQLSKELSSYNNNFLAYELMNEAIAEDSSDWNRVLLAPYKVIREREPLRYIAIGSNRWCQAQTFPELELPIGDTRIILVLHYYNPMLITHYRASWTASIRDYSGPINYPGIPVSEESLSKLEPGLQQRVKEQNKYYDVSVMEKDILPAIKKSNDLNLPLWCNEFGVNRMAPDKIREAWYRDFLSVLDRNSIGWSNWDFKGSFGIIDYQTGKETVVAKVLSENIRNSKK